MSEILIAAASERARGGVRDRWLLVTGLAWLSAATGFVSASLPPVVPSLMHDLALTPTTAGVALGAWQAVLGISSVPVGVLIPRWGPARVVAAGALVSIVSSLLRAVAPDGVTLVVSVAVGGVGWSMVISGGATLITTVFEGQDRRVGAGILFGALSAGFAAMLALGPHIATLPGGWRSALASSAIPMIVGFPIWLAVTRDIRASVAESPPLRRLVARSLGLLGKRAIVAIMFVTVAGISAGHALSNWLPTVLRQQGASASTAGLVAAGYMALGIASSLAITVMARPHQRRWWIAADLTAATASLLALPSGSPLLVGAAVVVAGIAIGSLPPLLVLAMLESPPARGRTAAASGLYYSMSGFAGLIGPVVVGVFTSWTGGFAAGLAAIAVLTALGAVLAVTRLPMPPSHGEGAIA